MLAFLMLVQTNAVRASMVDSVVTFWLWRLSHDSVLSPSVRMITTLSRLGAGAVPSGNGRLDVRACQAHTSPMVTLVLPLGLISSTLSLSAVQSVLSGIAFASEPQSSTGYSVLLSASVGGSSCTSKG